MGQHHDIRFPGESQAYRAARDELLTAEIDLRRKSEAVAARRRALPAGGTLAEDYAFDEGERRTRLSELFRPGRSSLVIYSFMYTPDGQACPACTALLDGLNGSAPHIGDRVNLAVVAKAPIATLRAWAEERGWGNLRLLSWQGSSYGRDYHAESDDFGQIPTINVFTKDDAGIRHSYCSELFFAPCEPGQHPRHADAIWPVWAMFDLTPDGRGSDWFPSFSYD